MISVIVPIYKVEPYLDQCIDSIVNQTYRDLEILLVDDGSPDCCGEICDAWAKRDERIHVIHKQNGGLSDARNAGIEQAHGAYLSFIDSDDYIESDMLERLHEAIEKEKAEMAVCNFVYEYQVDEMCDTASQKRKGYQIENTKVLSGKEFLQLFDQRMYAIVVIACNKLYRREMFSQIRYPKGKLHEDEFIAHRLFYPCKRIVNVAYVGYHYLQRQGSIMGQRKGNLDYIEALIDRCEYFLSKDEKELALSAQGKLLATLKKMQVSNEDENERIHNNKRDFWKISLALYKKGWIPFLTLCKRWIRCKVL